MESLSNDCVLFQTEWFLQTVQEALKKITKSLVTSAERSEKQLSALGVGSKGI